MGALQVMRGRRVRSALILAVALLCLLWAAPAFAACEDCHKAGGNGLDPALHPVPPVPAWDSRLGQCTTCHEVPDTILPTYQAAPDGPVPLSYSVQHRNQFVGMLRNSMVCYWCHDGTDAQLAHGHIVVVGSGDVVNPISMTGTIDLSGSDCAGCHTSGMAFTTDAVAPAYVPQIDPVNHGGDPGTAHEGLWDAGCRYQCHGGDALGLHQGVGCAECHALRSATEPDTCSSCHPDYHQNPTSTPASSPWSLALMATAGLVVVPVIRRAKTA